MKVTGFISTLFLFYVSSFGQSNSIHPDTLTIKVLKKRSEDFLMSGIHDSVIVYKLQLKDLYTKHKQWKKVVKCHIDICSSQLQVSKFAQAQFSFAEGLRLIAQFIPGDTSSLAELYNLAGILYYEQGDYEKAIGYLKSSLSYHVKLGSLGGTQDMATEYNNIAAIVSRMGDYDEAIYYYAKSLSLRKQHGTLLEIAESYNNLSVSYYRKKMFREALDYQLQHLEILNKLNDKSLVKNYIVCYNSLGIYYFEVKEYQKALDILNKALTLNHTSDYLIEKTYHNLGYVYRMLENDKMALHFLQLALHKNKNKYKDGHPDIGKEYRHLGVIYARRADTETALRYFQKALTHLVDKFKDTTITSNPELITIRSKPDLLRTLRDKATALRDWSKSTGDSLLMKASLRTFQLAMTLIEEMRDEYESEAARQFINEEALPIYAGALETINCLQGRKSNGLLAQAFEIIEKGKALLLTESLQRKKSANSFGVPDSLLVKERMLRTNIAFYEKQLAMVTTKKDSASIVLIQGYLHAYQDRSHQLNKIFEQNFPNYFTGRNHVSITSLEALTSFLKGTQTSLVEYFVSEEKLWTFLITGDKVKLIEKNIPDQFDNWTSSYQKCLRDYTFITDSSQQCYAEYGKSAYKLYQFLVSDVVNEIEDNHKTKLLIVPHEGLAYLPFESFLVNPAPDDFIGYAALDYLIKEMEVSYTYSGSLHLELHNKSRKTIPECIAFGPTFRKENSTYAGLPFLPHTKIELDVIKNVFEGIFLYDKEATKKMFNANSGQYGIIHLATHSVMDEYNPSNSRIYFEPLSDHPEESILYAYEIANLKLNAELVVLSSCETGSGKLAKGEGVMSIGRSFMYAGSRSVVMNLWRSEDKANAAIISEFYAQIGNEESKITSLRQAKLKYLQEADEYHAQPAFWAGYVLIGHEGRIHQEESFLLIIVVGVCFFICVGWLIVRRNI